MPATCEFYKLRNEQTGISTLFPRLIKIAVKMQDAASVLLLSIIANEDDVPSSLLSTLNELPIDCLSGYLSACRF